MQSLIPNIGAAISLLLSLMAIIWPAKTEAFASIKSIGKEGVSEVRATYGGFFAGISLYALITQAPMAFMALGCGWLCAALVRFVTLFFGSVSLKNIGGVIFEGVIGALCISGLFI